MSLAVQLGTLPIVVDTFGRLSIVGLAANLVVVPLLGVATGLGLAGVVMAAVTETLATQFNGVSWVCLNLGLTEAAAAPDWASITLPGFLGHLDDCVCERRSPPGGRRPSKLRRVSSAFSMPCQP